MTRIVDITDPVEIAAYHRELELMQQYLACRYKSITDDSQVGREWAAEQADNILNRLPQWSLALEGK